MINIENNLTKDSRRDFVKKSIIGTAAVSVAGKHVNLEKPCSHNPHEGELLVAVAAKYKNVIQMGNQRRPWPNVKLAMQDIKSGAIGRSYFAKGWYTNNRATIGIGKTVPVPGWLNYDLWQGPAPRCAYKDNVIHYNWHWGTGEALNNGTHLLDLMRWGLDVEYPDKVTSLGGRYRYKDDWEAPDTQVINLTFSNSTAMTWEGRSCNGRTVEGSDVGVTFYGETGSLEYGGGNALDIDPSSGRILNNKVALKFWQREYEKGWEPTL